MNLYLDIETIGTEDADVIADIAKGITPPKNYTKADTLAAWEKNDKPTLVKEAVAKTGFDGGLGRIVCIGHAFGDDAVLISDGNEQELLAEVFARVGNVMPSAIVGHNVTWDLRFLYQRAVVHGLQPPPILLKAMHSKPWDACIADTMILWNPAREKMISLDKLCRILGVETSKGDMDGSKVWETYRNGEFSKIAAYCESDVIATRECYRRLTWA